MAEPDRVMNPSRPEQAAGSELYRRLKISLLLRIILVTFLLGATAAIQFSQTSSFLYRPLVALYFLSAATYFIIILSLAALRWMKNLELLAYLQIVWEILFVTALVYVTGGIESIFAFLYLVAIIVGATLQFRRGSFLAALTGALCYGALLAGMESGRIPSLMGGSPVVGWDEIVYVFSINLAAMFGIAFLSSYLAEKLRSTGAELTKTMQRRDELKALNESIVLSIPSGLITLDLRRKVTSFNKAAEALTGFSAQEAIGKHVNEIFPGLEQVFDPPFILAYQGRKEVKWEDPEGRQKWMEFRVSPLVGAQGEPIGTLVIFNDITELRKMEEKLRKADRLAAVGQLAAGIAHEIRNPLASISGSIQVLARELNLDFTGERLMQIITRETERLNSLITDFLLYARPEPRSLETVKLDRLLQDVVEVFRLRKDMPPGVTVLVETEPELKLETDPKLIEQILWNLLNNAVQAMKDQGKVVLRAYSLHQNAAAPSSQPGSSENQDREDQAVVLEVDDTGPGIPEELKDKIFDPFFTTREEGTGLGLSTVYRIVEAMNGTIAVEDLLPHGARMKITLPRRYKSDAEPSRAVPDAQPLSGRR